MGRVFIPLLRLKGFCLDVLHSRIIRWTKPLSTSLLLESLADLSRSKSQLIAENALLRQQLIILSRQVQRPACTRADKLVVERGWNTTRGCNACEGKGMVRPSATHYPFSVENVTEFRDFVAASGGFEIW